MQRKKHYGISVFLPALLCAALLLVGCDSSVTVERQFVKNGPGHFIN